MNKIDAKSFKEAFKSSLPVLAGYVCMGIAFGILLAQKGYNALWALFIGLSCYAGSMQFVLINLLATGASMISSALMTFMVNARYFFYGISMIDKYKDRGKLKPFLYFWLTDETYALVCMKEPEGVDKKKYDLYLSILNQSYWVSGNVIGCLLGSALPFNSTGVDFAMTALFIVIFVEQLMQTNDYLPAAIGVGVSFVCLLLFGPGNFLIPSMVLITVSLLILDRIRGALAEDGNFEGELTGKEEEENYE